MSARASGADAKPNGNAESKHRTHNDGSSGRAYTVEQKTAVIRVRKCQPTAFYDILGLEATRTTCSDAEIKKAYRKLSLLTHPDKNGYEGADEAFKMVSRAFQILSDSDKKAKYDKFGGDPDNRFSGASAASASPFSGFARSPGAGGPMFEEEISPEEMFRQFFGGGMGGFGGGPFGGGGGLFDTGPGFVFNLGGGPGIRVHQFGGNRPRRRPPGAGPATANGQQPSTTNALSALLPVILLFLLPLLSSFLPDASSNNGPSVVFETPTGSHTQLRQSERHKVPYYVIPTDVESLSRRQWSELDKRAEMSFGDRLMRECDTERRIQHQMIEEAKGWFSDDMEKIAAAKRMPLKHCKRLKQHGYIR
jgi:DnaJ family protein B protein 12